MIDESNTNTDASESYPADKAPRVHLLVQRATHDMIETTRVAMRRAGLANVPWAVAKILEKDWTSDTMVMAGCTAIQTLLQPPEPDSFQPEFSADVEAAIAAFQVSQRFLPGEAGRIRAIEAMIEDHPSFTHTPPRKPAAKGKAKR